MEALVEKLCNRFCGVTGILYAIAGIQFSFFHEKHPFIVSGLNK